MIPLYASCLGAAMLWRGKGLPWGGCSASPARREKYRPPVRAPQMPCPGARAHPEPDDVVRYLPMFQALGYAAVIYDQRCFGQSTGPMCPLGYLEKRGLSVVISWVKQRMGEGTLIGVHGEPLGAITALEALGTEDEQVRVEMCPKPT